MDIEINQAHTGMALSQDVTDVQGHVLVKSGSALTERHLTLMRAHGIQRITVDTPQNRNATHADPEPGALRRLFRNQDHQHPLIRELIRLHQIRQPQTQEDAPNAQ